MTRLPVRVSLFSKPQQYKESEEMRLLFFYFSKFPESEQANFRLFSAVP